MGKNEYGKFSEELATDAHRCTQMEWRESATEGLDVVQQQ